MLTDRDTDPINIVITWIVRSERVVTGIENAVPVRVQCPSVGGIGSGQVLTVRVAITEEYKLSRWSISPGWNR